MYVLYTLETQTSVEKKSSFKVFFIAQISHTPAISNSNYSEGETSTLRKSGPHYGYTSPQGRIMQQKRYLSLTRNSFHVFFTANGIVSYREVFSSPFYVRFK